MNAKITIYTCIIITSMLLFNSCIGTRVHIDGEDGRAVARLIGQLNAEFEEADRRIAGIEETAGSIETDAAKLNAVLREYIRLVQSIRNRLNDLQDTLAREEERIE